MARWRLALACAVALALLLAGGAGANFSAGTTFATGNGPWGITLADVNGDNHLDLLSANYSGAGITVRLGTGDGQFASEAASSPLHPGTIYENDVKVADMNGDGKADIVEVNLFGDISIGVFLGDGTGHFTPATGSPYSTGGAGGGYLAIADFNGDKAPDVATGDPGHGGIEILLNDKTGVLTKQATEPAAASVDALAAGDFNGDKHMDIAYEEDAFPGFVGIMLGNGKGGFKAGPLAPVGNSPTAIVAGDFNGDKKLDVAVANYNDGSVQALLGNGAGKLTAQPESPVGGDGVDMLAVGDFNNDNHLDLVASLYATQAAVVMHGDGKGRFGASSEPLDTGGVGPGGVAAGDVDGDTVPDVTVALYDTSGVKVFVNNGPGPAPAITSFPTGGPANHDITITGTNLAAVNFVEFGGVPGTVTDASATSLTVTVPPDAVAGKITAISDTGSTISTASFTPLLAGHIASVAPAVSQKPGGTVTITGTRFAQVSGVKIDGLPVAYHQTGTTKITFTVPLEADIGATSIAITNPAGDATADYVVATAPTFDHLDVSEGGANATKQQVVQIWGANFLGTTSVKFHGKPAQFAIVAGYRIDATAPIGATTGTITVTNGAGTATTGVFTVKPPPTITSLSVLTGTLSANVVITGKNLSSATHVSFGEGDQGTVAVDSDTKIEVSVPDGASVSKLVVFTPYGSVASPKVFVPVLAPLITSTSISAGKVGDPVTITGQYFTKATSVTVNGHAAVFTVKSDTSIVTKIPAGAAASGSIVVVNPAEQATSPFSVYTAPTIAATGSFTPVAGGVGQEVVITGDNFVGTTAVKFNGHASTSFHVDSETQITADVPADATKGVITVTNPVGSASTTDSYTVVKITSFAPTTATYLQTVTVTGVGFLAVTDAELPGQLVDDDFSVVDDTTIHITVDCGNNASDPIKLFVGDAEIDSVDSIFINVFGSCS